MPLRTLSRLFLAVLTFAIFTNNNAYSAPGKAVERAAEKAHGIRKVSTAALEDRGVVVSCPRFGQSWATSAMDEALLQIKAIGANAIQIHPYARIAKNGEVSALQRTPLEDIRKGIRKIKAKGLRVFLKPHLAYWGSFSWVGAIEFAEEKQWDIFFKSFERFIMDMAELAEEEGVQLFSVGTELKGTAARSSNWLHLIEEVRKRYRGQLTYAANWDEIEKVTFWPKVDLIGVQFYFPLTKTPMNSEAPLPNFEPALVTTLQYLQKLSEHHKKQVLLAEIGYARNQNILMQPWEAGVLSNPKIIELRRSVIEKVTVLTQGLPWLKGLYWWKWMPGQTVDESDSDFAVQDPEVRSVLQKHWTTSLH